MAKLLSLMLFMLATACSATTNTDSNCMFNPQDTIAPNTGPEAEYIFQQGRAYDINVQSDMPDTILPELRGKEADRNTAKAFYQDAAQMGHTSAMNNLAIYLQNGFGNKANRFAPDHQGAFDWNVEMARRGDTKGYIGMAGYYFSGLIGRADPAKAQACLVVASKANDIDAVVLLGRDDLGLLDGGSPGARPDNRIARGLTLLEEAWQRGRTDAYTAISDYYQYDAEDGPKFEYYARLATTGGDLGGSVALEGVYLNGFLGMDLPDQGMCIQGLRRNQFADLESICPRPGGPLTRSDVGLPPQPAPIDFRAYLEDFAARNPDL